MRIDLFGDQERYSVIELDSDINELGINEDVFPSDSIIHIICKVRRDEDLIRVEGKVVSSAVLECSRCLEPFGYDITGEFSIVVRRLKKGEVIPHDYEDVEEEDRDNLMFLLHDEDSIDITGFVHDALLLSIPIKPLCDEHCKGLCIVCGNNLNKRECNCNTESNDPRWNALHGFFGDSEQVKK